MLDFSVECECVDSMWPTLFHLLVSSLMVGIPWGRDFLQSRSQLPYAFFDASSLYIVSLFSVDLSS